MVQVWYNTKDLSSTERRTPSPHFLVESLTPSFALCNCFCPAEAFYKCFYLSVEVLKQSKYLLFLISLFVSLPLGRDAVIGLRRQYFDTCHSDS